MRALSRLQDFAEVPVVAEPPRIEDSAGYREGFEAGLREAEASADAGRDAMLESLTRLTMTYAEARQEVLSGIAPLLQTIARHVLPATAPKALVEDLKACLAAEAEAVADRRLVVRLSGETTDTLLPLLPPDLVGQVEIVADRDVPPLAAIVGRPGGERILDRGRLVAEIGALFDAFTDHIEELKANG